MMSNIDQFIDDVRSKRNDAAMFTLQMHKYIYKLSNETGQTLLHIAAEFGNAEITQYLIDCGCTVDAPDHRGITPLMLAVTDAQNDATVEVLLKANADIHLTNRYIKQSALKVLIKQSMSWLQHLHADSFETTTPYRIMRMFFAKMEQEFTADPSLMLEKLRKVGCPLGLTIFMRNANVTNYLLNKGYPCEEWIRYWLPLHIAVLLTDVRNATVLLAYGADVNAIDAQGQTPLFMYDRRVESDAQVTLLQLLVNGGASLTLARHDGLTQMEYLFGSADTRTLLALIDTNTLELTKLTRNNSTPLHFLVQNDSCNVQIVVEHLITKINIDVNARRDDGATALIVAVKRGSVAMTKSLMKLGAYVNWVDIFKKTDLYERLIGPNSGFKIYARLVHALEHGNDCNSDCASRCTIVEKISKDRDNTTNHFAKLILQLLALHEMDAKGVNEAFDSKIRDNEELHIYYTECKSQLSNEKKKVIHGTVTLHKLLSVNKRKLALFARNRELVSDVEKFIKRKAAGTFYYSGYLQRRIDDAVHTASSKDVAARDIWKIFQLYPHYNHDVFFSIVDCLSKQDFFNLHEVQTSCKSQTYAPAPARQKVSKNYFRKVECSYSIIYLNLTLENIVTKRQAQSPIVDSIGNVGK